MTDLEHHLTGENLFHYKNIEFVKKMTRRAKALLTRSLTNYKDIFEKEELEKGARAVDELESSGISISNLDGACVKCGMNHGAKHFCIVDELIKSEAAWGHSDSISPESHLLSVDVEPQRAYSSPNDVTSPLRRLKGLSLRQMSPAELDKEYERICLRHGMKAGRKFLLAHSLAKEPPPLEPLFSKTAKGRDKKSNLILSSIMNDCVPQTETGLSRQVRNQKPPVLMSTSPPKKVWKHALKSDPMVQQGTVTMVDDSSKPPSEGIPISKPKSCFCGVHNCSCGSSRVCIVPKKKCPLTSPDKKYNYVLTAREKLRRRREGIKKQLSSGDPASSVGKILVDRKDSETMFEKTKETFRSDLRTCLMSTVDITSDTEAKKLDEKVSVIADDVTPHFKQPDEKAWDLWMGRLHAQEDYEADNDGDCSGISDIPLSASKDELTENEFVDYEPLRTRIPFSEETIKLIDIIFDKIQAKYVKTLKKNYMHGMIFRFKPMFFSRVNELMLFEGRNPTQSVIRNLFGNPFYFKILQPVLVRKDRKLKRLNSIKKNRTKIDRWRYVIQGIQLGKFFRRKNRSAKFTAENGFVGFKPQERKLLQNPTPGRFHVGDLVRDGTKELWLTTENIHRHYRFLRALFDGTENGKESLMDEGMKSRLENFRKSAKASQSGAGTSSDDDGSIKPVESVRRPSRRDEMKLKTAPGNTGQSVSSRKLTFPINHAGQKASCTKSSVSNGTRISQSTKTFSGRSDVTKPGIWGKVAPPVYHCDRLGNRKDTSYEQYPKLSQLPTPPLSDSSCDESTDGEISHNRVPVKEEAHMEKSEFQIGNTGDDNSSDGAIRFHKGKHLFGFDESEFTDKSSDSYVPRLLNLPGRTSKSPVALGNFAHRGVAYHKSKGQISSPYHSDTSSESEQCRAVDRIRPAWDRKTRKKTTPQQGTTSNPSSGKSVAVSLLPKAGASILKKTSLPKPPGGNDEHNPGVTTVKRQSFGGSSYRSSVFPSENLVRPAQVVTERLLRATQDTLPAGSSQKYSRATPEGFPVSVISSKTNEIRPALSKQLAEVPGLKQSQQALQRDSKTAAASHQEIQSTRESQGSESKASLSTASKEVDGVLRTSQTISGGRPRPSGTMSAASKQRSSRSVSDVFRARSAAGSSVQSDQFFKKDGTMIKSEQKTAPSTEETSAQSLMLAVRKIGPTKKRVFNVDVGQGINVVTYLKESAPGATPEKRVELVNLLVTPIEVKKSPKKPSGSLNEGRSRSKISIASQPNLVSRSVSHVKDKSKNRQSKVQGQDVSDVSPLQRGCFKTLDQIYKEVHGINLRNTPKKLVENDYEYELKKKQQLTKHRQTFHPKGPVVEEL